MVYLTWSFPLLTGSSALLFHSLSFPLLSLSFVSCFLFLFPVVFSCLFNPFSLSISFHFFPLSLFCFSMLLYPLSLSLPPLLYSVSSFSILGRRVAGSPGCRVAGYHCFSSLKPSAPSRALCSGSNKNFTVNLPDGNGNQLFTIQSLILQSEERVSEKRESEKKEDPSRQESGEVIRIQRCMMMQLLSTLATLLPPSLGFGTWPGSWLPYQKVVKGVQGTAPFGVPSERWATRRPGCQYL